MHFVLIHVSASKSVEYEKGGVGRAKYDDGEQVGMPQVVLQPVWTVCAITARCSVRRLPLPKHVTFNPQGSGLEPLCFRAAIKSVVLSQYL